MPSAETIIQVWKGTYLFDSLLMLAAFFFYVSEATASQNC
jgi:hypothetical protein